MPNFTIISHLLRGPNFSILCNHSKNDNCYKNSNIIFQNSDVTLNDSCIILAASSPTVLLAMSLSTMPGLISCKSEMIVFNHLVKKLSVLAFGYYQGVERPRKGNPKNKDQMKTCKDTSNGDSSVP